MVLRKSLASCSQSQSRRSTSAPYRNVCNSAPAPGRERAPLFCSLLVARSIFLLEKSIYFFPNQDAAPSNANLASGGYVYKDGSILEQSFSLLIGALSKHQPHLHCLIKIR